MQNKIRWMIWTALGALLLYFIWTVLWIPIGQTKTQEKPIRQVRVITITPKTRTLTQNYVGYVKPIHQVQIHAYITGFIEQIYVKGGQNVQKGDLLFTIQPNYYQAELDLAIAKTTKAEATLNNAIKYYERLQKAGTKAISKTDLDNAQTSMLTAKATLSEAKANEDLARVNLDYTRLYAPIDGKVGDVAVTVGDYIAPSSKALATIIQYNPIRVIFAVSNKTYLNDMIGNHDNLFQNQIMKIRLANGQIFDKVGQVRYLSNEITSNTNSLTVYADFENVNDALVPNAYVEVLLEQTIKDGFFLPQRLVNLTPNGGVVYTLDNNNKITAIPIQIGPMVGTDFYILSGLKKGMRIIDEQMTPSDIGQSAQAQGNTQ